MKEWLKPQEAEKFGITVVLREGEEPESLFKRFKKKSLRSGIEKEYYQKTFYEKPSVRKRRKKLENLRRMRREQAKLEKYLKRKRGPRYEDDSDK